MRTLVERFKRLKIAVLGDLMMDEYVWGQATRVSPESPVLVIDVQRETAVPGGAANVAANLVALGAEALVFGAVGDDPTGTELRDSLARRGVGVGGVVVDPTRPTTRKTRIVAQSQQVLRIDREQTQALGPDASARLRDVIGGALGAIDGVLVSDYAKGVVNRETVPATVAAARAAGKPVLANAKPPNAKLLAGASLVSVNASEAVATSGDERFLDDEAIHQAGADLRSNLGVDVLVVTRGPKGLIAWSHTGETVAVPAHPVEVYDVAGAGDTVVATLTLAITAGATVEEAVKLAVRAAAIVVGKVGVATVSADELVESLEA